MGSEPSGPCPGSDLGRVLCEVETMSPFIDRGYGERRNPSKPRKLWFQPAKHEVDDVPSALVALCIFVCSRDAPESGLRPDCTDMGMLKCGFGLILISRPSPCQASAPPTQPAQAASHPGSLLLIMVTSWPSALCPEAHHLCCPVHICVLSHSFILRPVPRRESHLFPEAGVSRVKGTDTKLLFSPCPTYLGFCTPLLPTLVPFWEMGPLNLEVPDLLHPCCHAHSPDPGMFFRSACSVVFVIFYLFHFCPVEVSSWT